MDISPDNPLSLRRGGYSEKTSGMATVASEFDFPTVRIEGPQALDFPEDCLVTFKVRRGEVVARSASRGRPASASVELHLVEVCDVEECERDEEEVEDSVNPIDRLFEQTQSTPEESEEDED